MERKEDRIAGPLLRQNFARGFLCPSCSSLPPVSAHTVFKKPGSARHSKARGTEPSPQPPLEGEKLKDPESSTVMAEPRLPLGMGWKTPYCDGSEASPVRCVGHICELIPWEENSSHRTSVPGPSLAHPRAHACRTVGPW